MSKLKLRLPLQLLEVINKLDTDTHQQLSAVVNQTDACYNTALCLEKSQDYIDISIEGIGKHNVLCQYQQGTVCAITAYRVELDNKEGTLDDQPIQCEMCGKCFKTMNDMRSHMKTVHQKCYTYDCDKCDYGTDCKSSLQAQKCRRQKQPQEHVGQNTTPKDPPGSPTPAENSMTEMQEVVVQPSQSLSAQPEVSSQSPDVPMENRTLLPKVHTANESSASLADAQTERTTDITSVPSDSENSEKESGKNPSHDQNSKGEVQDEGNIAVELESSDNICSEKESGENLSLIQNSDADASIDLETDGKPSQDQGEQEKGKKSSCKKTLELDKSKGTNMLPRRGLRKRRKTPKCSNKDGSISEEFDVGWCQLILDEADVCGSRDLIATPRKKAKTNFYHSVKIKCPVKDCDVEKTAPALKAHIESHHIKDENVEQLWTDYDERLSQALAFRGHAVTCPFCDVTRQGLRAIQTHLKHCHPHHPYYEEHLGRLRVQVASEALKRRKEYMKKPKACPYCHEVFPSASSQYHHTRFKCADNPNSLKGFNCNLCGTKLASQELLDRHKEKHKNHPYICELCGSTYKGRGGLVSHKRQAHSGEEVPKSHVCEHCGKSFSQIYPYKIHLTKHSDDRKIQCDMCGKCFKTTDSMKSHVKTVHQNRYTYYCDKCGHGVDRKSFLKTHKCGKVRRQQPQEHVDPPQTTSASPPPVARSPQATEMQVEVIVSSQQTMPPPPLPPQTAQSVTIAQCQDLVVVSGPLLSQFPVMNEPSAQFVSGVIMETADPSGVQQQYYSNDTQIQVVADALTTLHQGFQGTVHSDNL